MEQVLLLNSNEEPLQLTTWRRALVLLLKGKAECLEKMNYKVGDVLLCLGDLKQGIAFVKVEDYENFAQEIFKAKEKFNNDNSNN